MLEDGPNTDYDRWAEEHGVTSLPLKQQPSRITMDDYGLRLADVVKLRAACTRRQVGAVIIDDAKRIVATGYNGTEPGALECVDGACPRGRFTHEQIPGFLGNAGHPVKCIAQHAERNAIDWVLLTNTDTAAEYILRAATLYISCEPCPDCAALAAQYDLRVVWPW